MTKEEFIERFDNMAGHLIDKYSLYLYYLMTEVLNICAMEKLVEGHGLSTKRAAFPNSTSFYSTIMDGDIVVGCITCQGFPAIEFYKRKRKYAKEISKHLEIIKPIKGVHRILDWHTVRGKYHCLAGGETVLHFLPLEITDEMAIKFLTDIKMIDKIDEFKKQEE